jgi:hypothetical protein
MIKQLLSLLTRGFARSRRHPWLVLVVYLVPLLPALAVVILLRKLLSERLDRSLLSDRVLEGHWYGVWVDLVRSQGEQISLLISSGAGWIFLLSIALQIVLAVVIVKTLLESSQWPPQPGAVLRHLWRFVRSALWFGASLVLVGITASLVWRLFSYLAEEQRDARYDVAGFLASAVVVVLAFIPLDLAYDLSRIASVRHNDRSTLLGYLRALIAVLRRPALFAPLYLALAALPVILHLVYYGLRSPWTPGSGLAIVALLLAQQTVMVIRAFLKVWFWSTEVECYQLLGEPRWCRRLRPEPETPAVEEYDLPEVVIEGSEPATIEPTPEIEETEADAIVPDQASDQPDPDTAEAVQDETEESEQKPVPELPGA